MRNMRLKKREIKNPEILRDIIESCDVVRLGMTDSDGMFIVPVNFGYTMEICDGTPRLTLYIHGAKEGRKAEAIAGHPSIAIEMDCMDGIITGDYTCSYSCAYRSIMGTGTIKELTEDSEKDYALSRIMEHMAPEAKIEFRADMLDRTGVYRIDIEYFTGKERKMKTLS